MGEQLGGKTRGEEGKKCILQIVKEEWKSLKPSLLRYHQVLRKELGEGWIQSLDTGLEPSVQRLLREDWKEDAARYIDKLEEELKKIRLNKQRTE